MVQKAHLLQLLETLQTNAPTKRSRSASLAHLKSALYDWNTEQNWSRNSTKVFTYGNKGYMFVTVTEKEPRHLTLRHIFVLEQYRGQGIGTALMQMLYEYMVKQNVKFLRFFADLPSIGF